MTHLLVTTNFTESDSTRLVSKGKQGGDRMNQQTGKEKERDDNNDNNDNVDDMTLTCEAS